jgi:UDP-N-acetylglucosamine transferase subunit ALG13
MIFVTLGSQKFQFNRLLRKIDELIKTGVIEESVFAQIGASDYLPQYFSYKSFLNRDEFSNIMKQSNIVITHGGTGAIIGAVKKRKKVIAVPRLAKYGEHVDDHQLQLLKEFESMGIIEACYNLEKLGQIIKVSKSKIYPIYKSNTSVIIDDIDQYILSEYDKNLRSKK